MFRDRYSLATHRDGLNRYPMEYTLARHKHGEFPDFTAGIGQSNQGLVIISEFVSSARVMRGALNVNPWRVQEVGIQYISCLYFGGFGDRLCSFVLLCNRHVL